MSGTGGSRPAARARGKEPGRAGVNKDRMTAAQSSVFVGNAWDSVLPEC